MTFWKMSNYGNSKKRKLVVARGWEQEGGNGEIGEV